jgi:hypothetical protein
MAVALATAAAAALILARRTTRQPPSPLVTLRHRQAMTK